MVTDTTRAQTQSTLQGPTAHPPDRTTLPDRGGPSRTPTPRLRPSQAWVGGGISGAARMLAPSRVPATLLPTRLPEGEQLISADNLPYGRDQQEADPASMTARGPATSGLRSLSKATFLTPHPGDRPQPSSQLSAPRLPGVIQAKLVVGQINDPLEHEADRVADEVMRIPEPLITAAPPQISRKCATCEEEEEAQTLQTKRAASMPATGEAPSDRA